jgi:aminoglycoside phosphotransferase (APT) family kinase protein
MGEQGRRKVEREFSLAGSASDLLRILDLHREAPPAEWQELVRAAGGSWRALGLRRTHERPESSVAELLLGEPPDGAEPGRPRELVLKVHRGEGRVRSPRTARREFQALTALEEALAGASVDGVRLGTPRPLGLDDAEGAVLMEACAGEPLDALIRRCRWASASAHAQVVRAAALAGAWLRALQQHTAGAADPATLEGLCEAARADLRAAPLPPALAGRVRGRLETLRERLQEASRATVAVHGDFWPGNLFVSANRLDVMDLEGFGSGLPGEDAAYFAVQLSLFYAAPPLRSRGREAVSAFLAAWRGTDAPDPAAWALLVTAKALHVLARTHDGAGTLRRAWRRWSLHALLKGAEA